MRISSLNNQQIQKNITVVPRLQTFTGQNVSDVFTKTADVSKSVYKKFSKNVSLGILPCYIPSEMFNIKNPKKFNIRNKDNTVSFTIDFNPNRAGQLLDKKTKKPIDVYIIKTTRDDWKRDVSYYFVSKNLNKSYGYVELEKDFGNKKIYVNWLKNYNDKRIGGVGKLADRVAAKYCAENKIPFNICSYAVPGSMIAHYKRGKRFVQPKEKSVEYEFLMKNYGTSDVNEVLNNMIIESEKTGKEADLSTFAGYSFSMILPENLAKKYAEEEYIPTVNSVIQPKSKLGILKDFFQKVL